MDGTNMPTDNGKKILSFEEFCAANLGGMQPQGMGNNQPTDGMPGAEPEVPEVGLDQANQDQDDITLMDGPDSETPADGSTDNTDEPPAPAEPAK